MNINNTNNGALTGFQTTDGGYKYRRVQTVVIGSSTQTGLLELESKYSSDGKGVGRLLVRCEMPYFTVNTASCCCDDAGSKPTYTQAGKISFHTVLTLPKNAVADLKSANAGLTAGQIANIIGLTLGMSNTVASPEEVSAGVGDGLATTTSDGKLHIGTDDFWKILDPKRAVIRSVMGVTPIPSEGFDATNNIRAFA